MKKVCIIRHGETKANLVKMFQGNSPVLEMAELTEDGVKQAQAMGEVLRGKNIEIIYTSPLNRALDTAREVQKVIGEHVPIKIIEDFKEISLSVYEGRRVVDVSGELGADVIELWTNGDIQTLKEHYDLDASFFDKYQNSFASEETLQEIGKHLIKRWASIAPEDAKANFGKKGLVETKKELGERALRVSNEIAQTATYKNIAISGHGMFIGRFLLETGFPEVHLRNGEIAVFDYDHGDKTWTLVEVLENPFNVKTGRNISMANFTESPG